MINRRIRWLGFVLLACFVLLFLQLNNFQVRQANSLVHNPHNEAAQVDPYTLPRGDIYSSDGVVLALSKPTERRLRRAQDLPVGDVQAVCGYNGL